MNDPWNAQWNADGYMILFKGQPAGGAGVKLPREYPLRGGQVRANIKFNGKQAASCLRDCRALHAKRPFNPRVHGHIHNWFSGFTKRTGFRSRSNIHSDWESRNKEMLNAS